VNRANGCLVAVQAKQRIQDRHSTDTGHPSEAAPTDFCSTDLIGI
jgi:hypothetical protein